MSGRVAWVSRAGFGLEDGRIFDHPFELSEQWTVQNMQRVFDYSRHFLEINYAEEKIKESYLPERPVWREGMTRKEHEKARILLALKEAQHVQTTAARQLGMSHARLHYYIRKYGVKHPSWRKNK